MASAATLAAATSSLLRRSSPLLLRRPHGLRISRDVAPRRIGGSKKQETRTRNLELPVPRSVRHIASSTNEESAARAAAETADTGGPTIFDKIIAKQIPSNIVYEDEKVLAFRDINPQAPVHVLVIPKLRDGLTGLDKAEPRHAEILGQLLYAAKVVAEKEGVADGFRVVINNGEEGCQSVYHLHVHVLGGRQMKWPPG
ncbi:14 kDa zinc-binding protein isoform X1 [Brachypodium distachyon]|nr:14 kDa zinc-binding protein isoform X1 [Brachypodium distachyon]|eukprot:XP_010240546.1 14 kDa zinc-binding protein isoform X1 [Brachypodium distachyon]